MGVGGYLSAFALLTLILSSNVWPPSVATIGGDVLTADVPNKVAHDMLINSFAPHLEQPAELEDESWLGRKHVGRRSPCRRLRNHNDCRKGKRGGRQLVSLVGASWQNY